MALWEKSGENNVLDKTHTEKKHISLSLLEYRNAHVDNLQSIASPELPQDIDVLEEGACHRWHTLCWPTYAEKHIQAQT